MKYSEMYDGLSPKKYGDTFWKNVYLGAPTSPMTPDQLKQILSLVPSGIQNIEVGVLKPDEFEAIPKQHFEQMKQLAKLTIRDFEKEGKPSPLSLHAPLIEPTGFAENKWNEDQWKQNQAQLKGVIEKAFDLGTSTPVTIHGSHQISNVYRINPKTKEEELDVMAVVDPESGQVQIAKRETVYYPNETKEETPQDRLRMMNKTFWQNKQQEVAMTNNEVRKLAQEIKTLSGQDPDDLDDEYLKKNLHVARLKLDHDVFRQHLSSQISSAFDKAYKAAKEGGNKKDLDILKHIQKDEPEKAMLAIYGVMPDIFVPVEKFAREKASETFAELALKSIDVVRERNKKLPRDKQIPFEKAPIISVENVSPEAAFGRGKSMKALIEESRRKFVEKARNQGMSTSEATKLAEKLIGTTWDVGHINLLGRYGYSKEELKSKHFKELEEVKKYIKHVHLTDNFGYNDAHLPPGMGNIPIKEILKELEKAGKMGEIRAIVEAGGFVQHFKQVPTPYVLSELNSPIYSANGREGWGDRRDYFFGSTGYGAGYGNILPSEHFSTYGAGFSQLPTALGGVKGGGEKSKFSETPMS